MFTSQSCLYDNKIIIKQEVNSAFEKYKINQPLDIIISLETLAKGSNVLSDTVFLIDNSGSMCGEKMKLAILSLKLYVDSLHQNNPHNRIAIILYTGESKILINWTETNSESIGSIKSLIETIRAHDCENMAKGFAMGLNLLDERNTRSCITQVIVLSDGSGGCKFHELQAAMEKCTHNYELLLYGYGQGYTLELFNQIMQFKQGTQFLDITDVTVAEQTFMNTSKLIQGTFAQNITVQISALKGFEFHQFDGQIFKENQGAISTKINTLRGGDRKEYQFQLMCKDPNVKKSSVISAFVEMCFIEKNDTKQFDFPCLELEQTIDDQGILNQNYRIKNLFQQTGKALKGQDKRLAQQLIVEAQQLESNQQLDTMIRDLNSLIEQKLDKHQALEKIQYYVNLQPSNQELGNVLKHNQEEFEVAIQQIQETLFQQQAFEIHQAEDNYVQQLKQPNLDSEQTIDDQRFSDQICLIKKLLQQTGQALKGQDKELAKQVIIEVKQFEFNQQIELMIKDLNSLIEEKLDEHQTLEKIQYYVNIKPEVVLTQSETEQSETIERYIQTQYANSINDSEQVIRVQDYHISKYEYYQDLSQSKVIDPIINYLVWFVVIVNYDFRTIFIASKEQITKNKYYQSTIKYFYRYCKLLSQWFIIYYRKLASNIIKFIFRSSRRIYRIICISILLIIRRMLNSRIMCFLFHKYNLSKERLQVLYQTYQNKEIISEDSILIIWILFKTKILSNCIYSIIDQQSYFWKIIGSSKVIFHILNRQLFEFEVLTFRGALLYSIWSIYQ